MQRLKLPTELSFRVEGLEGCTSWRSPHSPAALQLVITNATRQLLMASNIQLLLLLPTAFFVLTGGTGISMLGMSAAAAALRSSSSIRPPRLSPRVLSPSCSSTNATGSIARAAGHGRGQHTQHTAGFKVSTQQVSTQHTCDWATGVLCREQQSAARHKAAQQCSRAVRPQRQGPGVIAHMHFSSDGQHTVTGLITRCNRQTTPQQTRDACLGCRFTGRQASPAEHSTRQ